MTTQPPTIDMLPDGSFRGPPRSLGLPFSTKLVIGGIVVAAVGLSVVLAAFALWIVSMVLPVVIIAGGAAWAAMRYRRWQLLRSHRNAAADAATNGGGSVPPQRRRFRE